MHKALKEREEQRELAFELANVYVSKLKASMKINAAIVYGSMARGDFNLGSDIDLLIISDELPVHPLERMKLLYSEIQGGLEPKAYAPSEIQKMLHKNNAMLEDAFAHGVVLWDDGTWKGLSER